VGEGEGGGPALVGFSIPQELMKLLIHEGTRHQHHNDIKGKWMIKQVHIKIHIKV
jgi:hypothetical protein